MKWYKHISDSIDDPFIFSLMEEFGGDGYLVFFGVLEIYSREFQTKDDWKLTEKLSYFRHKLLISQSKFKKILSKITKWDVEYFDDKVSIFIPKFRELLDESTLKKLRESEKSFRNNSGTVPKTEATDKEVDKDLDKDKEEKDILPKGNKSSDSPDDDKCPHKDIIKLYHEILPTMPKVKEWTKERSKILRSRWKEKPERQNLEYWKNFFEYVALSDFLMGKTEKPFLNCTLEWLIRPTNFVKVLEGNYHRKAMPLLSASSIGIMGWAERERARLKQGEGKNDE